MKPLKRSIHWLAPLLLITCAWPPSAEASESRHVLILLSDSSAIYRDAADALLAELETEPGNLLPRTMVLGEPEMPPIAEETLVVSIGLKAAQAALRTEHPTLSVLIPRQAFDSIASTLPSHRRRTWGAIYLDQPPKRHLAFVRAALPNAREVGLLIGPGLSSHPALLSEWAGAAKESGFVYAPILVPNENELFSVLRPRLASVDALMIQPDPAIVNPGTIQNLILTCYRQGVPVIGYSQALVKAGALAAVYSTPQQIGKQAGELINRLSRSRGWDVPAPRYPKYFTVKSNASVSRALDMIPPDDAVLLQRIEKGGS